MDQWLLPAWLDAAVARRLEALEADGYGRRLWEADASLWKPEDEAPPEDHRQLPRLAQRLRGRARAGRGAHRVRGRAACRGLPLRGPARHGRLEPRARGHARGPRRARGLPRPARARLDRPGGGARRGGRRGPRDDALRRLEQVRRHHGDGELPRLLLRAPRGAGRRTTPGTTSWPSPTRARRSSRRRSTRASAPSSSTRPTSAAATRRSASSAWCRRRSSASTSSGCSTACARRPSRAARTCRRARTPPCAWAPCSARRRSPAATSSPSSPSRRSGRSAPGSSSSSPRAPARRARGSSRWTSRGSATRTCTARTASSSRSASVTWRRRGWPGSLMDLAAAGHPVTSHEMDDEYGLGGEFLRWEIAVATAGRVLGIDPFDQPNVQESKDNTRRLLAGYIASGELLEDLPEGDGRLAYPVHDDELPAALAAFLAQAQPGDYVALQAYVAPRRGRLGPPAGAPPGAARRPAPGDHARLRPALPALHRAAPQGRPEHGPVPAARGARPAGRGHPRPAVQLQRAQAGAGAR